MSHRIAVINGPNMNLLGIREPMVYGNETWTEIEAKLNKQSKALGAQLLFFQSNTEGNIIDFIQENLLEIDGVVISPAGCTSTGFGILDALISIQIPFVEVHLSNIFAREERHHKSIFSENAVGFLCGFSSEVYSLGVNALLSSLKSEE